MRKKIKIGFSDIGGIYIGTDIQTGRHLHQAVTIAVSLSDPFLLQCEQTEFSCTGVLIQPNTFRKFTLPGRGYVAFIHIEPFSSQGLSLTDKESPCKILNPLQIKSITRLVQNWFHGYENNETHTEEIINKIIRETGTHSPTYTIDPRIAHSIVSIRHTSNPTLKEISQAIHLSSSRFSHLFKQQTGISFREFVLYTKLVKSLKAIYLHQSLTDSSYSGGFADQAHFTRTYFKAFGILPSKSVK